MSQQHQHDLRQAAAVKSSATRRVTVWGLIVNVLLSIVKFVVGFVAHSQALIADAVHSMSDSVTDLAVLIGAAYWSAPADEEHPHGHARIETLVTAVIGIVLALVGLGLAYRAIVDIGNPDSPAPGWAAFWVAVVSIGVKEWLYRWNIIVGHRIRSTALVANAWHHRSDGFSSIPVALAVLCQHLFPTLTMLDSVAAILVAALVVRAAWKIFWPALVQLCDAGVTEERRQAIRKTALETPGVRGVHALRTRYIGPDLQIDLHVEVDPNLSVREGHDIARTVRNRLHEVYPDVVDVLIHIEPAEE
ncbi:MAG: cation diffusion facilitator family transporter [Planctomycetia bacterium]|jgi:cation diffusion facilitator family transporter